MINSDKQVSEIIVKNIEPSNSTLNQNLSDTTLLETKGEVLKMNHNPHPELQVYTRKRFHKSTIVLVVPPIET